MVSTKVTLTWIKIYPWVSNIGLWTGPILNRHYAKLKLSSELLFKLSLIKFRSALSFFEGGEAGVYIKPSEGKKTSQKWECRYKDTKGSSD